MRLQWENSYDWVSPQHVELYYVIKALGRLRTTTLDDGKTSYLQDFQNDQNNIVKMVILPKAIHTVRAAHHHSSDFLYRAMKIIKIHMDMQNMPSQDNSKKK